MVIDNELKNQMRKHYIMGEYDKSYKILFKLYNQYQEKIYDRCYVLYNLSLVTKKMGSIEKSKKYIDEAILYMSEKEGYTTEKGLILWLYIELYKDKLLDNELIDIYEKLKECYNENDKGYIVLDGSIEVLKNNYARAEFLINKCYSMGYIDSARDILLDVKNRNLNKYNEILKRNNLYNKLA